MVTITSNYSEKLRQKIVNEETTRLVNFFGGEDKKTSRKEAARIRRIVAIHLESKVRNYYNERQYTFSRGVDEALETLRDIGSAQSKAERIFYVKLVEQKIPFYFQYPVGPYRADFLIKEILNVEIDGPQHNSPEQNRKDQQRNSYFQRMGYKVLRVPIWLLSINLVAVLDEIQEIIMETKQDKIWR